MARGPKPKPAAVRAQTNPVRSKRKPVEAAPVEAVAVNGVKPPAWLAGEGLEIWNLRAPLLAAAKLLTEADVGAFARYCRNFARWVKLSNELDKDGETYLSESAHGKLKRANPVFLIADRIERQLLAAEDRFGLNPAERQRIMAARSQSGVSGDLFAAAPPKEDPAAKPTPAAKPVVDSGPVGMLN
ncbi:phage terminase small subunit P27 family [Caulobacter sp.]|uniref:phage terminase small subunit P27 family n=1 Tax=Caulobacter sp. TaxID=78 RepID=UPI003BAF27E4